MTEKETKVTQEEFEKKVLELAEKGLTSEKIGEELRKQKIHPKEFKGKISQILKKENKYINTDLKNAQEKLEKLKTHYAENKQDKRSMREKDRIFSRVRRIKKYLKIPLK
jgi:ribosomal protein S15P/S13E